MLETQFGRVQAKPLPRGAAIECIAENRKAVLGGVHPDLVGASGQRFRLSEREPANLSFDRTKARGGLRPGS